MAGEIPLVTSHVDFQKYGGKFLCQFQKMNSFLLTGCRKNTNYVECFDGKMWENAVIMEETHWIVQKYPQQTKLIIHTVNPLECTKQQ